MQILNPRRNESSRARDLRASTWPMPAALRKARRRQGDRVEIAAALHLTVGGVKTRLHRARLFIRTRLAESLERSSVESLVESP
jgi:hypothetical protein